MSYDPQQVGRYGKLIELWAARNYPFDLDYPTADGLKFDLSDRNGRPWDAKGSMLNGVRPTFKFWKDQHSALAKNGGGYVLVGYRARGRDAKIKWSRTIRAADLRIDNWTYPGDTHHRSHSLEAQIPAEALRP